MDYTEIVKIVAPCGLNCSKCVVYQGGEIQLHSQALAKHLGPDFGEYAHRFAAMDPVFRYYEGFRTMLDFLAKGTCTTCRHGECLFKPCRVRTCVKEKGLDFCFQCKEFPCEKTGLHARLEGIWRKNNELMKEYGVVEYYEKIKHNPRYPS